MIKCDLYINERTEQTLYFKIYEFKLMRYKIQHVQTQTVTSGDRQFSANRVRIKIGQDQMK